MRLLLIKRDKLGDLLLTTPLIAHLSRVRPAWHLQLLANDYNAWVVRDVPGLERTWVFPRVRHAGRLRLNAALRQVPLGFALRMQRFDAAIVMGGDESHRGIARAIATGARRVIAYANDARRFGRRLTDPLPVPHKGHEVDRMAALLAPLGVAPPERWNAPSYRLPGADAAFARAWLAARGLDAGRYVVVGLGARRAKKQPDTGQIMRWTTRLSTDYGLQTVFMWTPGAREAPGYPGDDDIAAPLLARALPFVHPFRGPIPEALGLIFEARTSIFPDSGLMHFAAASRGGVLGLFADPGDSAPAERWAPIGPRALWLEAAKAVSQLSDEEVFAQLDGLLTEEDVENRQ